MEFNPTATLSPEEVTYAADAGLPLYVAATVVVLTAIVSYVLASLVRLELARLEPHLDELTLTLTLDEEDR